MRFLLPDGCGKALVSERAELLPYDVIGHVTGDDRLPRSLASMKQSAVTLDFGPTKSVFAVGFERQGEMAAPGFVVE
jgi:hypothetical protein